VTPAEILELIRRYRMAVVSTVAAGGAPQAAVVGFAISDKLEIVFDTLASTRLIAWTNRRWDCSAAPRGHSITNPKSWHRPGQTMSCPDEAGTTTFPALTTCSRWCSGLTSEAGPAVPALLRGRGFLATRA